MKALRVHAALLAAIALVSSIAAQPQGDAWRPLFNGRDLTGWIPVTWTVEDGVLTCSGDRSWLATEEEFDNFELELEFRLAPGGNSGVFLCAPLTGNPTYTGMEIQLLDDRNKQYANIEDYQYSGSLYALAPASSHVSKKAGEWQKVHIVCDGTRIKATLNDTQVVDADLTAFYDKASKHPGVKRTSGRIGLQNHGTRADFRNLRIRKL